MIPSSTDSIAEYPSDVVANSAPFKVTPSRSPSARLSQTTPSERPVARVSKTGPERSDVCEVTLEVQRHAEISVGSRSGGLLSSVHVTFARRERYAMHQNQASRCRAERRRKLKVRAIACSVFLDLSIVHCSLYTLLAYPMAALSRTCRPGPCYSQAPSSSQQAHPDPQGCSWCQRWPCTDPAARTQTP